MNLFHLIFFVLLIHSTALWAENANWVGNDLTGAPCKGRTPNYGPFDYSKRTTPNPGNLTIVEDRHFTPEIENLLKGNSSATPAGDLDYTLIAWPNHHRALLSAIKYQLNYKAKISKDGPSNSAECYLQRAIHFSPDDPVPYSLYGYLLRKINHQKEAVKYFEKAMELAPKNSKIAYSFSLLLIDLKLYDDALKYAKIAYQNKNAPNGLKHKLQKLEVWTE